MDLRKYQEAVLSGDMCSPLAEPLVKAILGMAAEAGECAGEMEKSMRGETAKINVKKLVDELSDTLWFLTCAAGHLGYDIEELASINYNKLSERHPTLYPQTLR